MTKKEIAAEKKRQRAEAKLRNLRSKWILLSENGYYLYTGCSSCGKQAYCRGRYREYVKCEDCFMQG